MLGREAADRATKSREVDPRPAGTEINKTKDFSESLHDLQKWGAYA